MTRRCAGRRAPKRAPRCAEQRHHHVVVVGHGGVVSVLTVRPRCLVIAPTVTGYGTA
jgi:hypothetical protein